MCYSTVNHPEDLTCCTCERRETWVTKLKNAEETAARAVAEVEKLRDQVERLERLARSRWGRLPWDEEPPPPALTKRRGSGAEIVRLDRGRS